jgi:hypothetical protein
MTRIPSINEIAKRIEYIDRPKARLIRKLMEAVYSGDVDALNPAEWPVRRLDSLAKRASRALELIDDVLDTCGVESIRHESYDGGYWGDVVASYCNTGDTYASTILFDTERDVFYVTSYGDWLEGAERTRRYKFQ